jgi:hypothetical protein
VVVVVGETGKSQIIYSFKHVLTLTQVAGKRLNVIFVFLSYYHITLKVKAAVPQFILDSLITSDHGSQASILVTQPRRLSAISVATRVSEERLNDGSVGYSIRGESKTSKDTRLLFCTTGVVLRNSVWGTIFKMFRTLLWTK